MALKETKEQIRLAGIASITAITALTHYQKEVTDNINKELTKNKELVEKMVNVGE